MRLVVVHTIVRIVLVSYIITCVHLRPRLRDRCSSVITNKVTFPSHYFMYHAYSLYCRRCLTTPSFTSAIVDVHHTLTLSRLLEAIPETPHPPLFVRDSSSILGRTYGAPISDQFPESSGSTPRVGLSASTALNDF